VIFFWTEFAAGLIMRFDNKNNNQSAVVVRRDSIPLFDLRLYDGLAVPPKGEISLDKKDGLAEDLLILRLFIFFVSSAKEHQDV